MRVHAKHLGTVVKRWQLVLVQSRANPFSIGNSPLANPLRSLSKPQNLPHYNPKWPATSAYYCKPVQTRVEISLLFLISSWVLVGPGLEFPNIEKTGRVTVSTRLVFQGQKKLIEALSGASEEFLVSLKYGKSICICTEKKKFIKIFLTSQPLLDRAQHGINKYWKIYLTLLDFWTGQIFPKILYTFYEEA